MDVRDVTDDPLWSEIAKRTVAAAYGTLADPVLDPDQVYALLCTDQFDESDRSRTLAAFTTDAHGRSALCGTARLIVGTDVTPCGGTDAPERPLLPPVPPIESMRLLDVPCWPHRSLPLAAGATGSCIVAEVSRFVIPDAFRFDLMKRAEIPVAITGSILHLCMGIASERGADSVYAIMPARVVALVRATGFGATLIEGCQLREEDPDARQLFDRFPVYWRRSEPQLYRFTWPARISPVSPPSTELRPA
jgi:hypothetical protein